MSMLGNGRERRNAKDSKQFGWPWGLAVMGKTLGSTAMLTFPLLGPTVGKTTNHI